MDKNILNQQSQHWETNFSNKPEMFGLDHSYSAEKTLTVLKENNLSNIVELGAGLGRDTIFFGKNSINVTALDYSKKGISIIDKKINDKDNSIEACYSHMLYCMALTNLELINLNNEVKRILKPGGLNIYTVRNTEDGDFKKGVHRGEDLYEIDGFIIHFFSKDKIESLLDGFKNLFIEKFDEGKFPRKLYLVCNKKT